MPLLRENYDPAMKYGAVDSIAADLEDLLDTNDNELLEYDQVTSAVNMLRVTNAAAGDPPTLTATGDDTNIGLQLTPTGTALVLLGNTSTGTIASGAVTINAQRGVITTGAAITTAGTAAAYSFDFVNNKIYTTSIVHLQIADQGGNGLIAAGPMTLGQGSATVRLVNIDQDTPVTGSCKVHFVVFN